ncbi:eukaryotic mitochondrial regulator protein-domain-containing protein [Hyaloraphidium curvatum]|nr:eukaryotic mitochondrial regulator protein-domain-containing protein [Hyaloraphidium curvatum]
MAGERWTYLLLWKRWKGSVRWSLRIGKRCCGQTVEGTLTGRCFVGTAKPFPMNPYFRVVPPVSDALRERIFAQFSEDPEEWTPRKLAEEHGLSMLRVQAILKLKVLERKLAEQGAVMQTQLTKRMEKLLEAESVRSEEYQEAPRTRVSFRSTPVFLSVDDYDPTLPEVFASSRAGSGKDVSDLEKLTYEGSPTIKTKHKFVIHDISKTAVKRIARDPKE